jgi:hypothetical protein
MDDTMRETQAAEYLGKSIMTLRRWRWQRKGPAWLKVGAAVWYRKKDLDAYVDACRVAPRAAA